MSRPGAEGALTGGYGLGPFLAEMRAYEGATEALGVAVRITEL